MIKSETLKLQLRRVFFIFILFASMISLTGCRSKESMGSIDPDAVYASIGDYNVTNSELWDEMKWDASDYIDERIKYAMVDEHLKEIQSVMEGEDSDLKTEYTEQLRQISIRKVYAFAEGDDYEGSVALLTDEQKVTLTSKYADNLYSAKGIVVDTNDFLVNDDYSSVYSLYYYDLAERLLAFDYLQDKMDEAAVDAADDDDEDTIGYYSKTSYINTFKEYFLNTGDVDLLTIRFMNQAELDTTLRSFGIKVYKNVWYQLTPETTMSYSDYCKYYDNFDMGDSATKKYTTSIEASYGKAAILAIYIEMYNYIYTYRDSLTNIGSFSTSTTADRRTTTQAVLDYFDSAITQPTIDDLYDLIDSSEYIHYTSEEINDISASMKTYVYDTLTTDETADDYTRYTTSGRNYGNYYYLIFKLDQVADEYADINEKDISTDDLYANIIANQELSAKILKQMKEDTVNDNYISNAISVLREDVKLRIYNKDIEIAYAAAASEYSKNHKKAPTEDTIATIEYNGITYTVTFDETWTRQELMSGTTTAVDILTNKIVKASDLYATSFSDDDIKGYKENLDYVLASFANNNFSSSGYPASIGKYNFMMLYFHSANVDEIIDDYYKVNACYSNLASDYGSDTLLNFLLDYTTIAQENYFSLVDSRLMVYIDMDEDGLEDPISEWTSEQVDAAQDLLDTVSNIISATTDSHTSALDDILAEYNSSSRFLTGDEDPLSASYDPTTPESTWADYRRLGLYLQIKSDSLANNVTVDVDNNVKERIKEIYNMDGFMINGTFPTQYLDNGVVDTWTWEATDGTVTGNRYLVSEKGLNLIVVTSGTARSSAKFEAEDDLPGYYTNINVIYNNVVYYIENIYNSDDEISMNQMKLFLYDYLSNSASTLSPSAVSSALTAFFVPVITRYLDDTTQREVLLSYAMQITGDTVTFTNTDNAERFDNIMAINRRVADNYVAEDDLSNNFAGWWDAIEAISTQEAN